MKFELNYKKKKKHKKKQVLLWEDVLRFIVILLYVYSRDMVWNRPLGKKEYYTNMAYYLSTYLHISVFFNFSENSSDHLFLMQNGYWTQKC